MGLDDRERAAVAGVVLVFAGVSVGAGVADFLRVLHAGNFPMDAFHEWMVVRVLTQHVPAAAIVGGALVGLAVRRPSRAAGVAALGVVLGLLATVAVQGVVVAVLTLTWFPDALAASAARVTIGSVEALLLGALVAVAASRLAELRPS